MNNIPTSSPNTQLKGGETCVVQLGNGSIRHLAADLQFLVPICIIFTTFNLCDYWTGLFFLILLHYLISLLFYVNLNTITADELVETNIIIHEE